MKEHLLLIVFLRGKRTNPNQAICTKRSERKKKKEKEKKTKPQLFKILSASLVHLE